MALPHNLEAERLLIGAIIARNELLYDVMRTIRSKEDFFEPGHGELYILLIDQITQGRIATPTTLMHDMAQDRDIGGVPAREWLTALDEEAPPGNRKIAADLAHTVADLALRRRILSEIRELGAEVSSAPVSVTGAELRDRFGRSLTALFNDPRELGMRHVNIVAHEVLDRLNEATRADRPVGLDIGLGSLQGLMGPLMPGRLYVIAGTPGSGKSALAQQIGEHIGWTPRADGNGNRTTLLCEIEMPAEEVTERSLAARTGISAETIERGIIQPGDYDTLLEATRELRRCEFYIDASPAPTIQDIRWKALAKQSVGGLDLLIIDHALYVRGVDQRQGEIDRINYNVETMKQIAKDLGIPVIALTQFGTEALRDMAKWPHRRPRKGDLYHGGTFDRHADVILIVHREEAILSENEPGDADEIFVEGKRTRHKPEWESRLLRAKGRALFILAKRRGGKGHGVRSAWFDDKRVRFTDQEPRHLIYRDDPPIDDGRML